MDQSRDPDGHLVDYKEPEELEKIMDFSLPDEGVGAEGIFSISFLIQRNTCTTPWMSGLCHKSFGSCLISNRHSLLSP